MRPSVTIHPAEVAATELHSPPVESVTDDALFAPEPVARFTLPAAAVRR